MADKHALGVALSGGGTRAMAFHRGTLRAMHDLGLVESVDVVSTVSGGSVFGAAWMCSIAAGDSAEAFLTGLVPHLKRGFVLPALLSLRTLGIVLPGYTRTHRLAEVFDAQLLGGRKLEDLPERPARCLNAAVLEHGMTARFARGGFSCKDVGAPKHYDPASAERANAVGTNFTGLSGPDIDALERHAMWQVHACRAVYGPILPAASPPDEEGHA